MLIHLTGSVLAVVAMVMYLYYTMFAIRMELKFPEVSYQPRMRGQSKRCRNLLLTMSRGGTWRRKSHVKPEDELARKEIDKIMRMRKGWPESLSHGDLFCGPKFPLPRYSQNQAELIAFDIQAQCDARTEAPCCHGKKGLCGSGPNYCTCPTCIDYRAFKSAELAQWTPNEKCAIQNYTQALACSLLSETTSSLTFIGDSLVRHFFSALQIILTSDPTHGALKRNTPSKYLRLCEGESQFIDAMCHAYITMQGKDICRGNKRGFSTSFVEAYSVKHVSVALSTIQRLLGEPFSYVLLGIGIHDNFNSKSVIENYLEPIISAISSKGNGWPRLIWLTTHAAGPLKPLAFAAKQGNERILAYNRDIYRYCQQNNITLFDTYNMTRQTYSYDGTHYGFGVNMMKAQILLNIFEDHLNHDMVA